MKHVNVWHGAFRIQGSSAHRGEQDVFQALTEQGGKGRNLSRYQLGVSSEELARHSYPRISGFATVHQGVIVFSGWESVSYWFIRLFD